MNRISKDRLCIAILLGIIFIRYFQTLIFSKFISKIFLVAHWDSLFYTLRNGLSFGMDSSMVQVNIPYRFFVAECWRQAIPLWNSLSGFGMPLLADPQAFVFSIFNALLIAFPSLHTWNLMIVLQITIGAISTYLLCREFELSFIAALTAALLFTFCPWIQWNLEVYGIGCCLTPFVFLFFVKMSKKKSFGLAILAGLASAIDVLAAHPEIAFITIVFSCLLTYLTAYYNDVAKFDFLSISIRLFIAGLVAFGICAPMLIPFVEYLANGETYKLNSAESMGISWQALFAHSLYPFYTKGSLFLGLLPLWGIPSFFCFFNKQNRFNQLILGSFVFATLTAIRIFPFNLVFQIPPFSMVYPTYCLSEYILFLSIISGIGISWLINDSANNKSRKKIVAIISGIIFLCIPLIVTPWHNNNLDIHFDRMVPLPDFNTRQWLIQIAWAAAMLIALSITISKRRQLKIIGCTLFVSIGIFSLLLTSAKSAQIEASFHYPQPFPLPVKIEKDARILSVGDHLFRPNTNLIYGLSLIQVMNPLFPKGYIEFVQACGAHFDGFTPTFSAQLSRLLDLTGTQIILSEQPVLDEHAITNLSPRPQANKSFLEASFANFLTLKNIELFYDPKAGNIFCQLIANPEHLNTNNYHLCFVISDIQNIPVSYVAPQLILGSTENQKIIFSAILPKNLKYWKMSLRLIDDKNWRSVRPTNISSGQIYPDESWLLGDSNQPKLLTKINNDRFRLISQRGSILTYENMSALNRCFFAKHIKWLHKNEMISYMKANALQMRDTVILDKAEQEQFAVFLKQISQDHSLFNQFGSIKKVATSSIYPTLVLQVDVPKTSLLVFSDLYYPGWKVYLDEKPWKMFRADYLFRSTIIPPGKHLVRFSYIPITFIIGSLLFIFTLVALLLFWLKNNLFKKPYVNSRTRN